MLILHKGSTFFNLTQLSLLNLFQMYLLEVLIMILTPIWHGKSGPFLNPRMNWLKEPAGRWFFEKIVISSGRGQTRIDWETVIRSHIHVGNLLFGWGKAKDFIYNSFRVLIEHTLSLIGLSCLAKARNESVFVHLRGFRWDRKSVV